jgi:hypothetical protein
MRSNRLGDYLLQSEHGVQYVPSRHCTFPDMSDAGQLASLRLLYLLTETPGSLIARRLSDISRLRSSAGLIGSIMAVPLARRLIRWLTSISTPREP